MLGCAPNARVHGFSHSDVFCTPLFFAVCFVGQAEWEVEFDRYKAFPEWQQRRSMTMDEFKHIFFWEVTGLVLQ